MDNKELQSELKDIGDKVKALATSYAGDIDNLLMILRKLEALHRDIREGVFEAALPNTRHDLYALLKEIEEQGGWPYIERSRLQSFLAKLDNGQLTMDN